VRALEPGHGLPDSLLAAVAVHVHVHLHDLPWPQKTQAKRTPTDQATETIYIYIYACTVPSSFSLTYDQESVHSRITRSTRWCSSASSKSAALFFRHRAKPASMAAGVVQDEAYKYCRDSPIGGQCFTVSCKRATPIACSWRMPKARRLPTHEGRRPGEYMRQEQILFRGRISVGREGLDMLGEEHLSYHRQVPDNG
jgi:hypothetical protein